MAKTKTNRRRLRLSHKRKYRKHNSRNKTKRGGEGYWERRANDRRIRKAKSATLWSPLRYAKESGRMGESVKNAALEKLHRRQLELGIHNVTKQITDGMGKIRTGDYYRGLSAAQAGTTGLEVATNAATADANARIETQMADLNSNLGYSSDVNRINNSNEVDDLMNAAAGQVNQEMKFPTAGKKRASKPSGSSNK